jgi:hypothetical protein
MDLPWLGVCVWCVCVCVVRSKQEPEMGTLLCNATTCAIYI